MIGKLHYYRIPNLNEDKANRMWLHLLFLPPLPPRHLGSLFQYLIWTLNFFKVLGHVALKTVLDKELVILASAGTVSKSTL